MNNNQIKTYFTFLEQLSDTESPTYLEAAPILISKLTKAFVIDFSDNDTLNYRQTKESLKHAGISQDSNSIHAMNIKKLNSRIAILELKDFKRYIRQSQVFESNQISPLDEAYFSSIETLIDLHKNYGHAYQLTHPVTSLTDISSFLLDFVGICAYKVLEATSNESILSVGSTIINQILREKDFDVDILNDYSRVLRDLTWYFDEDYETKYLPNRKKYEHTKIAPLNETKNT
jgi:hypothetical protein